MARATQRLYLTADGRVALHGDPAAVSLLCGAGAEIPDGHSEPAPEQEKVQATHTPKVERSHASKLGVDTTPDGLPAEIEAAVPDTARHERAVRGRPRSR